MEKIFTEYGKRVKKALIDEEKTQCWLIEQVNEKTGLHVDSRYLSRILRGQRKAKRVTCAINEILGLGN